VRRRARLDRIFDLRADLRRGGDADDGAERRVLVRGVAEQVLLHLLDVRGDERVVHVLVHVDALDGAARLARVVERAVDELRDRVREVRVGADIRRVLPAELERDALERPVRRRRRALHGPSPRDGAREGHEGDERVLHRARGERGREVVHLHEVAREARGVQGRHEALAG
jgi:hypothetical protein